MRPSLKLNGIEQEHLQELYDAAGVARDELPYTEQFDKLCQDFQDRAFKNADPEQVYAALLKYVKSSTCPAGQPEEGLLDVEKMKQLKEVLRRNAKGGKVLPYSSEFDTSLKEFSALSKTNLSGRQFWVAISRTQSRSRRAPRRAPSAAVKSEEDSGEDEE